VKQAYCIKLYVTIDDELTERGSVVTADAVEIAEHMLRFAEEDVREVIETRVAEVKPVPLA
jgi:hypothetical protein